MLFQSWSASLLVLETRKAAVAKDVKLVSLLQKEKVSLLGKTAIDDILRWELRQKTFNFLKAQKHPRCDYYFCRDWRTCWSFFIFGLFFVNWIQQLEVWAAAVILGWGGSSFMQDKHLTFLNLQYLLLKVLAGSSKWICWARVALWRNWVSRIHWRGNRGLLTSHAVWW